LHCGTKKIHNNVSEFELKKKKNALQSIFRTYFALAPKRLATPVIDQYKCAELPPSNLHFSIDAVVSDVESKVKKEFVKKINFNKLCN
jgi:hypothetical protein